MKYQLLPANHRVKIEGPNVLLQPISATEVNARYLAWLEDPETSQFIESAQHKEQTIEDLFHYINGLRFKPMGDLFAAFSRLDNRHIGNLSVTIYDRIQGIAAYGIMIGELKARRMGLGGEASALIIEYYFRDQCIRKVQGGAVSINPKAWRLMESLGYQREGIFREHALMPSGEVCDWYQYGLLRREWAQNPRVKLILKHMKISPYVTPLGPVAEPS